MTDDDRIDDDADDADLQLKQMRSVWLSMRDADDEPSDRGMAALMAAAREQANAMKPRASWWTKLIEQLRRPPVLAMATVVVLIGGAVVISQRNNAGEMKTESETTSAGNYAVDRSIATPDPVRADEVVAAEEGPGAETERDRDELASGSAAPSTSPSAPPIVTQRPGRERPKRRPVAGPADQGFAFEATKSEPEAEGSTKTRAPLELATGDDPSPKGGIVAESTGVAPPPAPAQDNKPVSRKPLPSIEGEDRASRDSTVAQLVKQCEAAAAKNDCAAVRTIARKIEKQDPSTYRRKVSKNAAVARCLEPPAPVEAASEDAQ